MIKKTILQHRMVTALCGVALLFVLGGFAWASAILSGVGGSQFILHFDDMQGITQFGGIATLVAASLLGVFIIVINYCIAMELEKRDIFLGRFVAWMTLVFAILLFIAFAAILNVN